MRYAITNDLIICKAVHTATQRTTCIARSITGEACTIDCNVIIKARCIFQVISCDTTRVFNGHLIGNIKAAIRLLHRTNK